MRIVNLIWGISFAVLGLFSCTSEELIEGPEQGDTSLAIFLSVGDVATKAIDSPDVENGYAIATENEIKINDFYVAIFDGNTNEKIKDKVVTSTSSEKFGAKPVTVDKRPGYEVTFNDIYLRNLGADKQVYALVIANAGSLYATLSNCRNYSEYVDANKVFVSTTAFKSDELVKAGRSNAEILSANGTTTLTVPLTQLCARIDFGTVGIITKADDFVPSSITYSGVNGKTNILMSESDRNLLASTPSYLTGAINVNTSFYTYEYPGDDVPLSITITGNTSSSKSGSSSKNAVSTKYVLNWSDIKDQNGNPVVLQHGYRYQLNVTIEKYDLKVTVSKVPWREKPIDVSYGKK